MRRAPLLALAGFLAISPADADPFPSVLEPASTGGLEAVDHALSRLATHRRLMILAAHPDDEDTRTLARLSIAEGGEAVYLSLTRGEGGQNLIGDELGEQLGVLRSRELEAARAVDGATQRFTRAYDFGYTRSMAETFERWPFEELLQDATRVVRLERPQVLLAVFPPTPRAGHGQHQASGALAAEVFDRASDPGPDPFPNLAAEGLSPWPIASFWRSTWWDPSATTLELDLSAIDPFSGRSILQLALESRSQHRCQDMGLLQPIGAATASVGWAAGVGGPEADDLFAGIDTRLEAIAADLADPALRAAVAARLRRVEQLATAARHALGPLAPRAAGEPLLEIVGLLRRSEEELAAAAAGGDDPAAGHARELVAEKLAVALEAVPWAVGLAVDATTDREAWIAGSEGRVRLAWWNAGETEIGLESAELDGWMPRGEVPGPEEEDGVFVFRARPDGERWLGVAVPDDARPTEPWYLERPRQGDLYDWSAAPPEVLHRPFGPPPLVARFGFRIEGVAVEVRREVVMQRRDEARGEVRRPLRVVPAVEVEAPEPLRVVPEGSLPAPVRAVLRSRSDEELELAVGLEGLGSAAPAPVAVRLGAGATAEVLLELPAREQLPVGRSAAKMVATTTAGIRFDAAFPLVEYDHVRPTPTRIPARIAVLAGDLRLPAIRRLGWIDGASERVPELLAAAGLPVERLDRETLLGGDLSVYDVLVVGSRAYETRPELAAANPRLLDRVRAGGTVIVLYQQYQFTAGRFAPFGLEIARPHDRITDETSAIRVLDPRHPVFRHPHRIGREDWLGWVQERGLYFAHEWSERYTPLVAMADPGGEELSGGLLVAPLGEGTWVYTGIAFFRQLPEGVPGAWRLFLNLLALGEPR